MSTHPSIRDDDADATIELVLPDGSTLPAKVASVTTTTDSIDVSGYRRYTATVRDRAGHPHAWGGYDHPDTVYAQMNEVADPDDDEVWIETTYFCRACHARLTPPTRYYTERVPTETRSTIVLVLDPTAVGSFQPLEGPFGFSWEELRYRVYPSAFRLNGKLTITGALELIR